MTRSPDRPHREWRIPAAALAIVALAGCSDIPTDPPSIGLDLVQGAPSKAPPDAALRDTLKVRAIDDDGRPLSGETVTWSVMLGGGSVVPVRDTTDADGLAMAVWTVGARSGSNEVAARLLSDVSVTFSTIAEAFRVDRLATGAFLGCGLVSGSVWCWGKSSVWSSGDAVDVQPFGHEAKQPGRVDGADGFTAIAASFSSVCALQAPGTVYCASDTAPALSRVADLPPLRLIAGAAFGGNRYCGLAAADSTAWCWKLSEVPAAVPGSPAFVDLAIEGDDAGPPWAGSLMCGIRADSTAACWGSGSLGNGSESGSAIPVPVSGGRRFAQLTVGELFACGLEADGEVWCWGRNTDGELGAPGPHALEPVLAASGVTLIAATRNFVVASEGGSIVRWGNESGLTPGPVASLAGLSVAEFAANSGSCVVLADRQVYCYDELWDRSSLYAIDTYSPVDPLAAAMP